MPTNRTKRTRQRDGGLTEDQKEHLLIGDILDVSHQFVSVHGDPAFPFRDKEHREELYFEHKDLLFSIASRGFQNFWGELKPGEKPKAYFDYEVKN